MTSKMKIFFYFIFAFSVLGFVHMLLNNPTQLLIMAGFVAVIIFLFRRFAAKGNSYSGDTAYQKALRQQKKRNKTHASQSSQMVKLKRKNRKEIPFTVIEGKKLKKDKEKKENFH